MHLCGYSFLCVQFLAFLLLRLKRQEMHNNIGNRKLNLKLNSKPKMQFPSFSNFIAPTIKTVIREATKPTKNYILQHTPSA